MCVCGVCVSMCNRAGEGKEREKLKEVCVGNSASRSTCTYIMEYNEAVSADREEQHGGKTAHPHPHTARHTHSHKWIQARLSPHTHAHTRNTAHTNVYTYDAFLTTHLNAHTYRHTHTHTHPSQIFPTGHWKVMASPTLSLHTHTPNDSKSSPTDCREVMALHTRLGSFRKSQYCV